MGDDRLGGDQSAGSLADLHFLHASAVLDLDLLRVAAVLSGSLSGKDHVVILVHGAGAVGLDVSQRSITHAERAAEQPFLAQPHADKIVVLRHHQREVLEVVAALCVQMPAVLFLVVPQDLPQPFRTATQFVPQREHHKRGVIAEGFQHLVPQCNEVVLFGFVVALLTGSRNGAPERQFRLHVDAQQICRSKGSVRRAAGVEAVVVDAVAFGDAQHPQPLVHICGSVAGFREDQSVVFAAEHGGLAVDRELAAVSTELPHAEADIAAVRLVDVVDQIIHGRVIFAPRIVRLVQRDRHRSHAVFVRRQLCLKQRNAVFLVILHDAAGGGKACRRCPMKLHGEGDIFFRRIRIRLHMVRIDIRKRFQRHLTGDAVPVGLGVRRGEVAALGGIAGVLHQHQNLHQRLCHIGGDVIDVRRAQTVTAAHPPAVDPEGRHAGTFQCQLHGAAADVRVDQFRIDIDFFNKCVPLQPLTEQYG